MLLAACSSTSTDLVDTWKAPGLSKLEFRKVLVLVISDNEAVRHVAEDALVERLNRKTVAVPAYVILGDTALKDKDAVREKLQRAGFDGAVTMRMIGKNQVVTTPIPDVYHGFWPYYSYGIGVVYNPGEVRTDTIVRLETNIYSLTDDQLLWSSASETFDPSDTRGAVNNVVDALASKLRRDGLID
jgi:hypothetical protein